MIKMKVGESYEDATEIQLSAADLNLTEFSQLVDVFESDYYNLTDGRITDYEEYGTTSADEATIKTVHEVKWDFVSAEEQGGWREFIQNTINPLGIYEVEGVLTHGINAGYTQLIWHNVCREVYSKHGAEIDEVIETLIEDLGMETLEKIISEMGFSCSTFVVTAFEFTLRTIIENELGLYL